MDLVQAAVLGVVQGATEYLPVSSSAHLVLVPAALGWPKPSFAFDVLIQLGTLLGLLFYYQRELREVAGAMIAGLRTGRPLASADARYGWLVGLATLPVVPAGLLLKPHVEAAFHSARSSAGFLLVTAALLVVAERAGRKTRRSEDIGVKDALAIGVAQACALFPGISRSGSTIAGGMLLHLDRSSAARFSFFLSIPAMVGASALVGGELARDPALLAREGTAIAVGFVFAMVSGYVVIKWFLGFLRTRSLGWFAAYCAVVGSLGVALA